MSDVVVDSSVWIDFFRGDAEIVERVDALLADDRVAVTGPIIAEVSSGARTVALFEKLRARLGALTILSDPPDLWQRVGEVRFGLARKGVQAHIVDLSIALTARAHAHCLLTRDRDFGRIADALSLELDLR
jgi:predicted nucleic acid-binding protein